MANKLSQRACLFNCDGTYKLDAVERFLMEVQEKHGFEFSTDKRYFGVNEIQKFCETILPHLEMDFAIFVVHAEESRLSINEDNAGIGYTKIYRALLQATDGRVLIVIGGDDHYTDEDEEERTVISRWARRKVASQFNEEYLDGRKSFIFSWNKQHRQIHEEALLHYFDPRKKGRKFEYQPKPVPLPKTEEPIITPASAKEIQRETEETVDATGKLLPGDSRPRFVRDQPKEKPKLSYGATNPVADYPANTMLLETRMRYGEISYEAKDVLRREDSWLPSERNKSDLKRDHWSTYDAKVQFVSQGNGEVTIHVVDVTPCWHTNRLPIVVAVVVVVVVIVVVAAVTLS